MQKHIELINSLYTGLQNLDSEMMLSCYHENATFRDPVFELHSKREIHGMWTMLCSNAKEFELRFDSIQADNATGSAHIEAKYVFSSTGRKVHNKIDARFRFRDGLIIEHKDSFDFWRWSKYALGLPGYVLGWTDLLQNKVRKEARRNLDRFMMR